MGLGELDPQHIQNHQEGLFLGAFSIKTGHFYKDTISEAYILTTHIYRK